MFFLFQDLYALDFCVSKNKCRMDILFCHDFTAFVQLGVKEICRSKKCRNSQQESEKRKYSDAAYQKSESS
jgi:hypothetical protein